MTKAEERPQQASPSPVDGGVVVNECTPPKKREMPGFLRKLQGRAHWFAPNLIPAYQRDAEYERRSDRKSNEESSVPEDTKLRVRALWGVEVFGPIESERLYQALSRLNWSAGGMGRKGGGALAWVQQQRSYGLGGNYNVGMVVRPDQQRKFLGVNNQAEMPDGVDHLLVRIHQICPAVTCLVVCFVLDKEAAKRYEQELNLERRTRLRRGARSWVPVAAREICKSVERPGALKSYCGSFTAPNFGNETTERDFAEELRRILHYTASTLLEDESSTREHFEQLSSVLSIRESIGAQRRMEVLTAAALLVAGLSLATAWPESWDTEIKSWISKTEAFIERLRPDDPQHVR